MADRLYRGTYTTLDPLAMYFLLDEPGGPVMTDTLERAERIKTYAATRVRPSRVRGGKGPDGGRGLRDSGDAFIGTAPIGDRASAGIVAGDSVANSGGVVGIVRFEKSYATFVDQGTKPHEIRAKNAPVLSFFWPKVGTMVAFRKVNHPGGKPTNFLSGALVAGSG